MGTSFELSPEAGAALRSILKGIPDIEHPVIGPVQDSRDAAKRTCGIGIYDKRKLDANDPDIVSIDGLEFYIDPSMSDALAGQTLAYVDGNFVIT